MTTTTISSPTSPENQDNVLVIGAGFSIEGHVRGDGVVLVNGSIKGNVHADTVKLSASGHVEGHIECQQLDVAGRIDGGFTADNVLVRAGAMVSSSIQSVSRGTFSLAGALTGQLQVNKFKIESTGQFSGQIHAAQMDVHGHLQGEIHVDDMVVRETGTVDGKLLYGNLSMERGSDVSGQLQRKESHSASVPARANDTVVVHFPVNIVQQLRKNPQDLLLSLANGEPLPSWITVDREHSWLVLGKEPFTQLSARGETINLLLQAGTETLIFKLPPEA
jgi:cytoskeletal protein CcmA (bactofilin family)